MFKNGLELLKDNLNIPTHTWLGYATLLIQYKGWNILTNFHFIQRASPVGSAGTKKDNSPRLSIDDLPIIDLILTSDNHYTRLDKSTIKTIINNQPNKPQKIFVHLKLK